MQTSKKPFFSVLTPSWNRADFLGILINSLQNQTFQDFEWVIGNDGSVDNTHEILTEKFNDLNIPITYIASNIRIGKSKLDNLLLDNAKGKYLVWCDADDFFTSDALECIFKIIQENKINSDIDIAGVISQNVDTNGKSQTFNLSSNIPPDGIYKFHELEQYLIGDCTICVKNTIFDNKRWPEVDFLITESILLRPLYKDKKFYFTADILKIMDRGAENSVSFGTKLQYCRGSAYSLARTLSVKKYEAMSIFSKIQKVVNYFRYCSHGDIPFFEAVKIWQVIQDKKWLICLYSIAILIVLFDLLRNKVIKTHIEFEHNKKLADINIKHF
jgi:glycosyltransferase involved in cell wall biosynthesis